MECACCVLFLPYLFGLRPGTGIEVVAARVTGGQCLVPMQAGADGVRHRVVGPAHDGKDIPVAGSGGEGAETAGGETYLQGIRCQALLVMGGPVVLGPDAVCLVDLPDIGILVLVCEERRGGILASHDGDGIGGIAHLAVKIIAHSPIKLFHRFIQREPDGSAHEVHLPAVASVGADGRSLLKHSCKPSACIPPDGLSVPVRVLFPELFDAGRCHDGEHRPVDKSDSHSAANVR